MTKVMTLKKTRISHLLLAALTFALATAGCSSKPADDQSDDAAAKAEVTLTKVVRADISETLTLTGTAAAPPNQDVRVSALVPGRIASLDVAEGDRVKAGQTLAKLDNKSYLQQIQQAEAAEQQAKANLENAQLSRTRNEDLFQRGIAARKDMEDARTEQSIAVAALQQADAALELARLQLGRTEITSPLTGIVAKRFVSVGEQVDGTAAQPIVEVANLDEIEFQGNAPSTYLAKIHAGERVDLTAEAIAGQKFPGHVVAISPTVDPTTGVGLIRIRVPNSAGLLRMGMFLSAEIPIDTHTRALVVPPQAIYHDEAGDWRVFIVSQNNATAVPVKVGIQTKESVELLDGVKEGDTVILTGGYGLSDKAAVQVMSPVTPSAAAPREQ
jgi:membrane fusion protein (multidrug efflux system)